MSNQHSEVRSGDFGVRGGLTSVAIWLFPEGTRPIVMLASIFVAGILPTLAYVLWMRRSWSPIWPFPPADGRQVLFFALGFLAATLLILFLRHLQLRWLPELSIRPSYRTASIVLLTVGFLIAALLVPDFVEVGDDLHYIRGVSNTTVAPSEPLGRVFHHLCFRLLCALRYCDRLTAVQLSSILAGCALLIALLRARRSIGSINMRPAAVLLVFLSPGIVFFLGYPETTCWAYAFLGIYLLTALDHLETRPQRVPWLPTVALMLAIGTHGSVLFALLAHACLLFKWWRAREPRIFERDIAVLMVVALLPFTILVLCFALVRLEILEHQPGLWYANTLGGPDHVMFVRFSAGPDLLEHQYVVGSTRWWRDALNHWLRMGPLVLVLPFAGAMMLKDAKTRWPAAFLLCALAGLLPFSVLWNADLGMFRDQDLLSLFTLPLTLLVLRWWHASLLPRQATLAGVVIAVAVIATRVAPHALAEPTIPHYYDSAWFTPAEFSR